jgi:vancomycin aglycone glucosyltransferase
MRQPSGAAAQAATPTPEQIRALVEHLARDQFEATATAAEGCDVIVAGGEHQDAARSIAERRGIPFVVAVYAPVALPSPDHAPGAEPGSDPEAHLRRWEDESQSWNARLLKHLNDHRERLGLGPLTDVKRQRRVADRAPGPCAGRAGGAAGRTPGAGQHIPCTSEEPPAFPHESTADQLFGEIQFEVYRALGEHLLDDAPPG